MGLGGLRPVEYRTRTVRSRMSRVNRAANFVGGEATVDEDHRTGLFPAAERDAR